MTQAVTRKEVVWEGDSLKVIRTFPVGIQYSLGVEIGLLQDGRSPTDVKPFKTVGPGCFEVRAKDESGAYRAIYVLLIKDKVHVLHCFQKKSSQTAKPDVEKAAARYKALKQKVDGEGKK